MHNMSHMSHILHSAVVAGYLPLIWGAVVGVVAVALKYVGAEWLDLRMYNSLLDNPQPAVVHSRVVREGGVVAQGVELAGQGELLFDTLGRCKYRINISVVQRKLGEIRSYSVLGSLPALLLLLGGCAASQPHAVSPPDVVSQPDFRSDRSYSCAADGRTWVCSVVVETFRGGTHPLCSCSTRGSVAHCTCRQPQPVSGKLAIALPLEDLR